MQTSARQRDLIREAAVAGLGVLLIVLAVFFTPPSVLSSLDYVHFYQPNFRFLIDSIRGGELPWWNPHIGLGRPFAADLQNAVFYPPLYAMACGERPGLILLLWSHGLLAVFGLRWLGALLGMPRGVSYLLGVTFLLAPPLAGRLFSGQVLYACGLCYLPLLHAFVVAADAGPSLRRTTGHAFCLALQLLCGHPQVFWLSLIAQGAFLVGRACATDLRATVRRLARAGAEFAGALLGALALGAVALLPFLDLIGQGNRDSGSAGLARFNQMNLAHLLTLAGLKVPGAVISWEGNLFLGPLLLLAGGIGLARLRDRNARGLLLSAGMGLIIGLGDGTPWFDLMVQALPGYSSLRLHVRAGVLVVFAVLLGAGLCLARPPALVQTLWTLNVGLPLRHLARVFVVAHLTALLAGAAAAKWGYALDHVAGGRPDPGFEQRLLTGLRDSGWLRAKAPPPRVFVPQKLIPINHAMIHGYAQVDAYTSLFLQRPWAALHARWELPPAGGANSFLSPAAYERPPFAVPELGIVAATKVGQPTLLWNSNPPPRAWVVFSAQQVAAAAAAHAALHRGHPLDQSALLEQPPPLMLDETNAPSRPAVFLRFQANVIDLEVDLPRPGLLVLAEAWYPGWRARVDGSPVAVLPANGWMRALPVPAGRHQVRVHYEERRFRLGAWISAIALVAALAAQLGPGRPRQRAVGSDLNS